MWPGFLLERHIKGMRSIQICLHPSNGSLRPAIGQTLWLVQDEGKSTQVAQYVRVTKVSVATRTFVDEKGQAYLATVQTLDLSDPLENDFTGTSANPRFVAATGAAVLRDAMVVALRSADGPMTASALVPHMPWSRFRSDTDCTELLFMQAIVNLTNHIRKRT